jgi:hypothetical protein
VQCCWSMRYRSRITSMQGLCIQAIVLKCTFGCWLNLNIHANFTKLLSCYWSFLLHYRQFLVHFSNRSNIVNGWYRQWHWRRLITISNVLHRQ